MDSLTHIVLGACIGEAMLDKKLGKKAMLWGGMAQSVPDIDFLASFWMDTAHNLLAHRGLTHSFIFGTAAALSLALAAEKWHRPHNIALKKWFLFFLTEIGIHLLLDACNNYGVGWFEPFSSKRISFNNIFVADPFFSLGPAIAFFVLLFLKTTHASRVKWVNIGMLSSLLYMGYTVINKLTIDLSVRNIAEKQQIQFRRYFTTPSALNNWLWYFVLEDSTGFHTGYRSVFDRSQKLNATYFPQNDSLLRTVHNHEEVQLLKKFSQGYYTVEQKHDSLVFNDLRFGQIIGWMEPKGDFVFHFYLSHPEDNELVVQRGRFAKWDKRAVQVMLQRIRGN
jgi:inner membrane protein